LKIYIKEHIWNSCTEESTGELDGQRFLHGKGLLTEFDAMGSARASRVQTQTVGMIFFEFIVA